MALSMLPTSEQSKEKMNLNWKPKQHIVPWLKTRCDVMCPHWLFQSPLNWRFLTEFLKVLLFEKTKLTLLLSPLYWVLLMTRPMSLLPLQWKFLHKLNRFRTSLPDHPRDWAQRDLMFSHDKTHKRSFSRILAVLPRQHLQLPVWERDSATHNMRPMGSWDWSFPSSPGLFTLP